MSRAYTIRPDDIRTQEFRSRMRGYDPAQVRSYLEELADQVQHMHVQMRDLRNRLSDAQQQLETSPGGETTDVSIPAPQVSEDYHQAARADAQDVLAKAQKEADALIANAQADVDELRKEIADLNALRERIVSQIETLLNSQLEHLDHLRKSQRDSDDQNAPEAPPTLANLDDTTPPV
ncbi:MAG: DivIVA domain-containing protein [candidate division Zixibacteria bacterium]|nr:DivIVA domain-containing protein [candidate division Zixibacteria bacterium]